jgi:hypothetical protein
VAASAGSAGRHASQVGGPECPIRGIRPDHRHVGHAVANLEALDALADLIDLPDDVLPHHERRLESQRLGVEMASDQHLSVVQARSEHADSNLGEAGSRRGGVDDFQPVGPAEACELNNPVALLSHGCMRLTRIAGCVVSASLAQMK